MCENCDKEYGTTAWIRGHTQKETAWSGPSVSDKLQSLKDDFSENIILLFFWGIFQGVDHFSNESDEGIDALDLLLSGHQFLQELPVVGSSSTPRRSFESAALSACGQGQNDEEGSKTLWTCGKMGLQPFNVVNSNNIEQIGLIHRDSLGDIIGSDGETKVTLRHMDAKDKRKWGFQEDSVDSNSDAMAVILSITHYGITPSSSPDRHFDYLNKTSWNHPYAFPWQDNIRSPFDIVLFAFFNCILRYL